MRTPSLHLRIAALTVAAGLVLAGCSSETAGTAAPPAGASGPGQSSAAAVTPAPTSAVASSAPAVSTPDLTTPAITTPDVTTPDDTTPELTTPELTSSDGPTSSYPELTIDPDGEQAQAVIAEIQEYLLTPEEVGEGFTTIDYTPTDPRDTSLTQPCGQMSTAVVYPNAVRTGTSLVRGQEAQFDEVVNVFLDEDTATEAFAYAVEGLNCTDGMVGGNPVVITDAGDVTDQVGGDEAHAWTATLGDNHAVLMAVRSGALSLGFTFVVAGTVDTTTLPDPLEVVAAAVTKLEGA